MPPPPPDTARAVLALIFFILYFSSSSPGPAQGQGFGFISPHEQFQARLALQQNALAVLNETQYGEFRPDQGRWDVNLTGFRKSDAYMWESLGSAQERFKNLRDHAIHGPPSPFEPTIQEQPFGFYQNVTAFLTGSWARTELGLGGTRGRDKGRPGVNLTDIAPGTPWGASRWDRNITGESGSLSININEEDNMSKITSHNHTSYDGAIAEQDIVRELSATMTVSDKSHLGDGWVMRLHGVHWAKQGTLVLATTSDKFAGIFGLPHLTLSEEQYKGSQKLLTQTLGNILRRKAESFWVESDPWSDANEVPSPHCEYIVYGQVHSLVSTDLNANLKQHQKEDLGVQAQIADLERELRFPSGAPRRQIPSLSMSLLVFSPDCGFMLESKGPPEHVPADGMHLRGLKREVYVGHVKHWSLIWCVTILLQIWLLRMQMKDACTPSTIGRVSLYTVGMMASADGLLFGVIMLVAIEFRTLFPMAMLAAFTAAMSMGIGVRFLAGVYQTQEPERLEAARIRAAQDAAHLADLRAQLAAFRARHNLPEATGTVASLTSAANAAAQVTPVSNTESFVGEQPIIIPSDQDVDAEIAEMDNVPAPAPAFTQVLPTTNPSATAVPQASPGQEMATTYGQILVLAMLFFILTVSSISWPTILRRIYFNTVSLLYLSFWTPQIYRNVLRNCRKAFLWKFVIGQSVLRLLPFAYFYLREDNILSAEKSSLSVIALAGWLWLQIWALVAQEILGPRFCLPKGWLPEAWDYHPTLREDDAEAGGMPIGLVQGPTSPAIERTFDEAVSRKSGGYMRSVDCAICMQSLDVPVVPTGADNNAMSAGGVIGMLERRKYMVTPCRHAFHSTCLEGWMRYRLQCPICRENLPPL